MYTESSSKIKCTHFEKESYHLFIQEEGAVQIRSIFISFIPLGGRQWTFMMF